MTVNVSLKELIETGAHFGHQSRRWNPEMAPYLYGVEEGVHLFDLTKTKKCLDQALEFLKGLSSEGKVILLVGTKKQAKEKIREVGEATGCPYVSERWLGGTLTNFEQIKRSIDKLAKMKEEKSSGAYQKFTKKERLLLQREIDRLERFLGGLSALNGMPDAMVIVDTHKEAGVIREAAKKGVTTIGIVDSNSDPTVVDYPIPMNDDASKAVEYVLEKIGEAILEGKKKTKAIKQEKEE
ncbi:30S ribosomal protein S2 [Candidatus Woesebacteria bacterium GWA1_41_8]|uniref:Small ribosomal subunit protein uS2 n=1 Tax=Candidatus Woesebacteria bacterium GWA1_41_8 TaxID=1802471 RepID=A0A1F7WHZ8_9BACT|nr:MAG: 30S ribosomal protein S2 [Candidatus Woesebacteria bacterium GWA1_41_8]